MTAPPDDNEPLPVITQPDHAVRFGAAKAIGAFFIFVVSQLLVGIALIVLAMIVAVVQGENVGDPRVVTRLVQSSQGLMLLASGIASAVVVYLIARLWAWPLVLDRGEEGIGMKPVAVRSIAAGAGIGIALSACYLTIAQWLVPFDPATPLGPLATAAKSGGTTRLAWAVLAVLFAPAVEEVFFRGLLLKGFVTTWGFAAGSAVTTILFVCLHLFETLAYWPASVAVTALALATLGARVVSGSIVTAIAVHTGYNAIIVAAVYTVG